MCVLELHVALRVRLQRLLTTICCCCCWCRCDSLRRPFTEWMLAIFPCVSLFLMCAKEKRKPQLNRAELIRKRFSLPCRVESLRRLLLLPLLLLLLALPLTKEKREGKKLSLLLPFAASISVFACVRPCVCVWTKLGKATWRARQCSCQIWQCLPYVGVRQRSGNFNLLTCTTQKLPGNSACVCVCVPVSITGLTLRESYKFFHGKLLPSLFLSHTASALPELKRRSKVGNGKCNCQWRRRTSDKLSLALTLPPLAPSLTLSLFFSLSVNAYTLSLFFALFANVASGFCFLCLLPSPFSNFPSLASHCLACGSPSRICK